MNKDLFLAILAMDSYNRGYGTHIRGLLTSGYLGDALINRETPTEGFNLEQVTGFYVIKYTAANTVTNTVT
jgi:hypothetical protein